MTLTLAWIRKVGSIEELVLASDSRLRGMGAWDACPKIFALPRNDAAIGFCGFTADAYPFILQLQTAISLHRASMNRSLDLTASVGHYLRVLQSMRSHISSLPRTAPSPTAGDVRFVIAGYCWRSMEFKIWQFRYNTGQRRFESLPSQGLRGMGRKMLVVLGDPWHTANEIAANKRIGVDIQATNPDVQREAYSRLVALIRKRGVSARDGFDMEPFEVLVQMIRSNYSPHVGGAPQIMKVYKYGSVQALAVRCSWVRGPGRLTLMGRPLMSYEKYDVSVVNAMTRKISRMR